MKLDAQEWAAVSPLFDAALDQPPELRARWLADLPAEQQPLRGLLERLLASHARVESAGFMGVPPVLRAAEGLEEEAPPASIGPYRLLHEIGRGGMGRVWLAEPADGLLQRKVAIKLPHPGLATRAFAERLRRERDILASLTHPHIARLYDAGVSADGQPYIALEYVEGRDLIEACDAQHLGVRERIELFLQVLSAVQYAHAHLVIHRDLKPSNVLVDAEGQVRLLDFGVAKLLVDGQGEATELTLDAGAALTPDFAAPEQLLGQPLGTASDIYALGVLLYELLCGRRPYHLPRQDRTAMAQTLLTLDLPRPSVTTITDAAATARGSTPKALARSLHGDLDTIVLKALKPRPEQRYESATAFQADLQRYLRGEPVLARPDGAAYRLRRFVARNRWAVAGAALAVTAISVAAVGYAIEAHVALAERDYALMQAYRSDAITRFLNDLLEEATQAQHPVSVRELVQRSETLIASSYRDNPEHRAAVLNMLASYHITMDDFTKADPLIQQALAAAAGSTDAALLDQLHCSHALVASNLDQTDAAKQELLQVLAHPTRDPRGRAECLLYLSFIAHDERDAKTTLAYARQALDLLRAQREPVRDLEAQLLANLGSAYQDNADIRLADRYFSEAMQLFAQIGRDRGPVAMTVRNNLAVLRSDMGQPVAALALLDEALQIAHGEDEASRPPIYPALNRAHLLRDIGRYEQAQAAYELARGVAQEQDNPGGLATSLLGMAGVARELGDLATAQKRVDEARAVIDARLEPGSLVRARLGFETASLLLARGQAGPAQEAFEALLKVPAPASAKARGLLGRADSALQLGRLDAALADARKALEMTEALRSGFRFSSRSGVAQLELSRVLQARGDVPGAAQALKAAGEHFSHTVDATQWQRVQAEQLLQASATH